MLTWGDRRAQGDVLHLPAMHFAVACVAYSLLYLGAAAWAFRLAGGESVLVWFPPAGVAMAGLAIFGSRLVPVALAAEVASTAFISGFGDRFGPFWIVVNAAALVGAYSLAGLLVRRAGTDLGLRRLRDVLWLGLATMLVGPAVAAAGGVLVQLQVGLVTADEAVRLAAVFWLGDAVAAAALVPVLVVAGHAARTRRRPRLSDRGVPMAALVVELMVPGVASAVLFAWGDPPLRFVYLVVMPLAFIAIRHGIVGAVLANVGFSVVMVVGAYNVTPAVLDRSDTQLLMAVLVFGSLVLGAVESQRRDLLRSEHNLGLIVEASPDLIGTATLDGKITYLNPAGRTLLGLHAWDAGEAPMLATSFYDEGEGLGNLSLAFRTALKDGSWSGENLLRAADGRAVPVSQVMIAHAGRDGEAEHLSTVCRDVTEERRLEAQLGRQALYDDTTGLANRALLTEHLARALADTAAGEAVAVLLIDLRRFGLVNESLGYRVGDEVLSEIAGRLRDAARSRDLVARHGGDVFAVVLEGIVDEVEAIALGSGMLATVSEPVHVAGKRLVLDAHLGIALVEERGREALDVVRAAQIALSRAKESEARFALFDPRMDERARDRLELENDLRSGIDSDQWWMAYQPVVAMGSRRVESCEALLRWEHPDRGMLAPMSVVALAESTGLILPLGQRILTRVCEQTRTWRDAGHAVGVAINVSGKQLQEPGFAASVLDTISTAGLDPASLTIEITETVFASALDLARKAVEEIRSGGCVVAMDDFGTGYSSLAGLRDLPIDVLKLDRSFITELAVSDRAAAMVEAVVAVAKALDLRLIAEGVEEQAQLDLLAALGCDHVQGFVFARPMPPEELARLLVADEPLAVAGSRPA